MTSSGSSSNHRLILLVTLVVYVIGISIPLALSVVLLFTAETLAGRIFAIDALVLLAFPIVVIRVRRNTKWRFRLPAFVAAIFVTLLVVLRILVPKGPSETAGPGPATRYPLLPYRPWALSNLLPEIDQLKLGTYFVGFVDPILNHEGAARFRTSLLAVYRPMEQDPAFRDLGSALFYAYADANSGHLYEYIPVSAPRQRPPAVVFLHGSGGNFKGYLQVWKPIADATGVIVVAPSFGFGNWQQQGGVDTIERARRHAVERLGADPTRIYLAGLSNGGRGVTRAIASLDPEDRTWAGVIFISAVMETSVIEGAAGFRGMPVLVVHGKSDDRIPWGYVEKGLAALRTDGANLTIHHNQADHFIFFSRAEESQQWIREWLSSRLLDSR